MNSDLAMSEEVCTVHLEICVKVAEAANKVSESAAVQKLEMHGNFRAMILKLRKTCCKVIRSLPNLALLLLLL